MNTSGGMKGPCRPAALLVVVRWGWDESGRILGWRESSLVLSGRDRVGEIGLSTSSAILS